MLVLALNNTCFQFLFKIVFDWKETLLVHTNFLTFFFWTSALFLSFSVFPFFFSVDSDLDCWKTAQQVALMQLRRFRPAVKDPRRIEAGSIVWGYLSLAKVKTDFQNKTPAAV